MEILSSNLKKGYIKLKITSLDDLWYLTHLIEKKDLIRSTTTRKIKLSKDNDRKQTVIKKKATITIEVEKFELTEDSLRVSGLINKAPEDFQKGAHHTIELKEQSKLILTKPHFFNFQIQRIKEATKEKSPPILICILERDSAYFSLLKKSKIEELSEISVEVQKKGDEIKKIQENQLYQETIKLIKTYLDKYKIEHIIIASPAFWKEELIKELEKKAPELKEKVTLATCNSYGKNAVNEILKRDELKNLLKQERIAKEMRLVEQLLEEISKNNLAIYGFKETQNAANIGAVSILLITDQLIKKTKEEGNFEELDNLMKLVENTKGEIHIISTDHEAGKKLQGLTGIAAILRYSIY